MSFDASVTLAWFFEDEFDAYADAVSQAIRSGGMAVAPLLWTMETAKAERRGRLTREKADEIVTLLRALPISFDMASTYAALRRVFSGLAGCRREASREESQCDDIP